MKVTVTVRCSFCARSFAPSALNGNLIMLDTGDRLCCDACLCSGCGHGHATAAEFDACYATMDLSDDEILFLDSDAAYELQRDLALGVE